MGYIAVTATTNIDNLASNADAAASALAGVKDVIDTQNRKRGTKDTAKAIGELGEDLYFEAIQQSDGQVGYDFESARRLFAAADSLQDNSVVLDDSP